MAVPSIDILSICTGGGGLDLGVELALPGARSVCMVEREAFAVAQLVAAMEAGHLAPAPVWSDARTFNGRSWRGLVDGLIGGIPCQPHSLAGRKQGQHDERDLWSDARRIIVQSGCWFVLIENVSGMLSAGADEVAGAERVWRDLRKLGFAVEGGLFTAAEVGASHERERVFILGVADAESDLGRPQFAERTARRWRPRLAGSGDDVADAIGQRGRGGHARWQDAADVDSTGEGSHAGPLVNASLIGRREGQPEPELRSGRGAAASAGGRPGCLHRSEHLADSHGDEPTAERGDVGEIEGAPEGYGWSEHGAALFGGRGLSPFPPGPGDLEGWRRTLERAPELEPAVRRVADGLASRLDIARVDRLRLLGNGVVPLQAAYAFRTLVARLAARGSAGATRLVRMMEQA